MNFCETLISQAIGNASCDTPIVKGYERVGYVVNRADVDFSQSSVTEDGLLNLVLKDGKTPFPIYQPRNTPFSGTGSTLNVGTYTSTFDHTVGFVILGGGKVSAKSVNELANGEFICVLEHKDKNSDNRYEAFGYYQGLTATEITREEYNDDTIGGWSVVLTETGSPVAGLYMEENPFESLTEGSARQTSFAD